MASTTTILTRHDVTVDGSDLSASMMLNDDGHGHVMVSTAAGPSFSMDSAQLAPMIELLIECQGIRALLHRDVESPATPSAFD